MILTLTAVHRGRSGGDPRPARQLTATATITDNDTAVFTIEDVTVDEGAGTLVFTVSVSNALDIPVTIDVTYADVTTAVGDFTHTAGHATFAARSTTAQTVSVPITDDTLVEATETFTASLATATVLGGRSVNLANTGTGTITDNDAATVSIAKTADGAETGPAEAVFTVTQTLASSVATMLSYTVGGSAVSGGTLRSFPGA